MKSYIIHFLRHGSIVETLSGKYIGTTDVPLSDKGKTELRKLDYEYRYPGAQAVFTKEGLSQIKENINYYREKAKIIADTLTELGIEFYGGINSPYIWLRCPNNMKSWDFFDYLLENVNVVGTPGAGFGKNGEGFFRLTSFNNHENTREAMERFKKLFSK